MYHRAVPLQWSYLHQPFLDVPRNSSPLYFTGCTELYPVIPIDKSHYRISNSRKTLLPSPTCDGRQRPNSCDSIPKSHHSSNDVPKLQPTESTIQGTSQPQEAMVPQLSLEILLGADMEHIIQIVKSATEVIESSSVAQDLSESNKTDSSPRGVKRHIDSATPEIVQASYYNLDSKRQRLDSNEILSPEKVLSVTEEASKEFSPSKQSPIAHRDSLPAEDSWEKVSKLIWRIYMENKQSEEMFVKKTRLRDALHNLLKNIFPYCGLYIVGSSLNSLGTNSSDLDMCLMLSHSEIDQEIEATSILGIILRVLRKCDFVQNAQLIPAKVPILKFFDTVSGVEVDLNVNNSVGIRNTQLMHCYASLDWRVQPLVLLVKMWAKEQDINDAKNMTLSSYSLVLMVIHFLQFSASPVIIPCLQESMPNKFQPHSDIRHLVPVLREELPPFKSNNKSNLGELMLQFFEYYSHTFQFHEDAISVRTGGIIAKNLAMNWRSPKNKRGHWKFISIEEPFDRTNTARSVFNEAAFHRILSTFQSAFERLKETKDLSTILDLDYHLL